MDPRIGDGLFLLGLAAFVAIRAPHDRRRRSAGFSPPRLSAAEWSVLSLMFLGLFVLPLLGVFSPWLSWAEGTFTVAHAIGGTAFLAAALWLFHRSHADLGRNWSPLLQLRAEHELVASGVYRSIRHPMYASFFLYGIAQWLLLANWVAGPSFLIAATALYFTRVGVEERMMAEQFGDAFREYAARTGRLIPRVW